MNILITGTSTGIGRSIAMKFLEESHTVYGIDILESTIKNKSYKHFICDVSKKETLPDIANIDVLVNNAGIQTNTIKDIEVNALGPVYCTEKYGITPNIKSIVNIVSTSAHSGAEFPLYACSKGSLLTYTKNTALEVCKYGATCNSVSPGGVITDLNKHILESEELYEAVKNENLLHKWAKPEEVADIVYFLAIINKSITGQDIIIDNGESIKYNFIW